VTLAAPGLGWPPDDPGALERFPRRTLPADTIVHRVHRADRGPWWFASVPDDPARGGRFDLAHPKGACYAALTPQAGLLEVLRRRPIAIVPAEEIERRVVTSARLPRPLVVANATAKRASAFGVTGEIHTTLDRARTRAWAMGLHRAGFPALLSIPRHDPQQALRSVTLFDRAGEHEPFGWPWTSRTQPIDDDLIASLAPWGVRAAPIPAEVPIARPSGR
jgi:hypothetical protein